jgi:ABC-type branched-subunit amino acid transport system ATPase component
MDDAVLEVRDLAKSFGGVAAVRRCRFAVRPGLSTALIGPNGAGKTTVLNLVSGFLTPDHGTVVFRGEDITALPPWRRSRLGLSRTFQLARLFRNLTVQDNLLLAVRQDDDLFWRALFWPTDEGALVERVRAAADFVGLRKRLDVAVTDLSYGEQKLFDLCRALLNPHAVLLLDEPVAGVNPVLRTRLREILRQLKEQGETVLFVEHDMDFVRAAADRVVVMDQGAVLVEGEAEAVLHDQRVLNTYLGR